MGKGKRKGRAVWKWILGGLGVSSPAMLAVLGIVFLGSGAIAAFSMVGGLISGLFGTSKMPEDAAAKTEKMREVQKMDLEGILDLVNSGKIDASFYDMMFISREELKYLLEEVKAYNSQEVARDIRIECRHEYTRWVDDAASPDGGYHETIVEYPYRTINVRSSDIEKFYLDWQLVYALCLTNTMNGVEGWTRQGVATGSNTGAAGLKGAVSHYGADHEVIDHVMDNVKMQYEYITDLARETKAQYTLAECEAMVHTRYEYGDADTEEGSWLYYVPHSVISRAYSGFSCMYYTMDETGTRLERLVTCSDMAHFEQILKNLSPKYNFGYFKALLNFVPGGSELASRLGLYYDRMEEGCLVNDLALGGYELGSGIDQNRLPFGRMEEGQDFGDLLYNGDLAYDETTGGDIAREAVSKIGCAYDQDRRWEEGVYDCSSLVWRVLKAAGIDLSGICSGDTAAEECRGMVDAGLAISPQDIRQGDIVFYSSSINGRYRNVTHAAIYVGDGKLVHARGKKRGVQMSGYYTTGLVCVCRPYTVKS